MQMAISKRAHNYTEAPAIDMIIDITTAIIEQVQKPTLAFLLGGMLLAALGSRLEVPEPVYKFVVMLLLLKVGLGAGISIREADLVALAVPAVCAVFAGIGIVLLGGNTLARWRGVSKVDAYATAGLFGAVSASTLAAAMALISMLLALLVPDEPDDGNETIFTKRNAVYFNKTKTT
jgi:hypothetical protein